MGPNIIFDKSFIQSLAATEIDELAAHFEPVCVPTLMNEIFADLRKETPPGDRVPEEIVKLLARKMAAAHGLEPISPTHLLEGELMGNAVPMTGTVPVGGPHVRSTAGGKYVMYDSTPQQRMWQRLAAGDFNEIDIAVATTFRGAVESINPDNIRENWQAFARDWLRSPKSFDELLQRLDEVIDDVRPHVRREILRGVRLSRIVVPLPSRRSSPWLHHGLALVTQQ